MENKNQQSCSNIKLLITDVDGVLTDGKLLISSDGSESKMFCVEDGTGFAIAKFAKLPVIFLSGRYSKSTDIRAEELYGESYSEMLKNYRDVNWPGNKQKLKEKINNLRSDYPQKLSEVQ